MFMRLLGGQGVKKHGLTLISGPKQVMEILRDFPERCEGVLFTKHLPPLKGLTDHAAAYKLSADLFREVDVHGTAEAVLLVSVPLMPLWEGRDRPSGCTLFVPFQDPGNVGAVIRCAAAFGVSQVVLLKESAHPFHHKSLRAAGSSILRVPLLEGPSIKELATGGFPIITLSARGKDITRYRFPSAFCLLPGIEGPGLPAELDDLPSLAVPMEPGVESLNAAVATGIALYVWRTSRYL